MEKMSFQSNVHILSTLANNIKQAQEELYDFVAEADIADGFPERIKDASGTARLARINAIHRAASLQASADALALYAKTVRDQIKEQASIG